MSTLDYLLGLVEISRKTYTSTVGNTEEITKDHGSSKETVTSRTDDRKVENEGSSRKFLLYKGYYYDVTSFVAKHPGGDLIKMYLNNSEDATHAIEQFHHRSAKRVQAILHSFPRRKATEAELIGHYGEVKLERHRALTRDFEKLFQELQDEGLFEPSISHALLRYTEITAFAIIGIQLFQAGWAVPGLALLSWAVGRSGWFVHESGHHSLTGKPDWDRWIQNHIYGIFCGLSGSSWRNHHSKHHAMPQHFHNDVDVQTLPIMAFHQKVVTDPETEFNILVKYQKYTMYFIQGSMVGFFWKYWEDPIYALKNGCYWDLFWIALNNVIFIPLLGLPCYLLVASIAINYLFLNSTLSHTHLPITEEPTHWVEYSLVHTANVRSSWWVDYFMGYLNYQIEHHMFPTMPQFRNKLVSKRVKALAKKFDLPYHLYDFKTILKMTVENLGNVSDHFTRSP